MAKKSLFEAKFYKQGETGAIRARKPTTDVRGGTLVVMAGFSKVMEHNKMSTDCSDKLDKEEIRKGSRGRLMRACLRSAGLAKQDALKQAVKIGGY
ncbi:MAG: hypothetical protein ACP5M9_04350 [Candidatus Micrarchaeia archaeon]